MLQNNLFAEISFDRAENELGSIRKVVSYFILLLILRPVDHSPAVVDDVGVGWEDHVYERHEDGREEDDGEPGDELLRAHVSIHVTVAVAVAIAYVGSTVTCFVWKKRKVIEQINLK